AAAITIDDAASSVSPYRRNCRERIHPAATKARNIISPKVVISNEPILMRVGYIAVPESILTLSEAKRKDLSLHRQMSAYVYIMSNQSHMLYVGSTDDLLARVRQHRKNGSRTRS